MVSCVCVLPLLLGGGDVQKPPPLTEAQRIRLTKLVRATQMRAADLKQKLTDRQNELTRLYAKFDLNHDKAIALKKEILTLQNDLLTNYHRMQVELRTIVGRERFFFLQKRLARVLGVTGPKKPKRGKAKGK